MTLIVEVMENPLDPAYAEAAARRRAHGRPSHLSQAIVLLVSLAIGVGLATAALTLRAPGGVRNQARDLLIEQIVERREISAALLATNTDLSAQVNELSSQVLQLEDPALASQLERLAVLSGAAAVAGEALVFTLSDSAQAVEDPTGFDEERVQAVDLQVVVNALWAGGAEAVSVNGVRVGANGSIRGAGQALLVDLVPVGSPYEVVAIGPVSQMQQSVAGSTAAQHLEVLRSRYHIGVTSGTRSTAWMPGTTLTQLRFAEVVPNGADGHTSGQAGQQGQGQQDPDQQPEGGSVQDNVEEQQ